MSQSEPTGLIAKKGLELLTFPTPNGVKISILLEELKATYGTQYTYQAVNIMKNTQKEPWFTALGPNGKIPVLVDHDKGGLAIMEGFAILNYLTRHYDPDHKFAFTSDPELSHCEQWMAWQHGALGPMQGQTNQFYRFAKERIAFPTQRFLGETERLYGVLDNQLKDKEYLVGNKYSIADINSFGWVNAAYLAGIDLAQFPNVQKWWKRVNDRPAVQKGLAIPYPSPMPFTVEKYLEKMKEDPEFKQKEEELKAEADKAKEQYDYKYASP